MRISGGEAKGRTLNFPSRSTQRPTTDFLREALFNLLGLAADQSFLDLFAGSGSVGLEALSRQAKKVAFVEKSKILIGVIRENVSLCGYSEKCLIIHADIQSALRDLYRKKCRFNVIFADPPYNQGFIGETLKALKEYPVLQEDGIIALQHSIREQLTPLSDGWFVADQRKYGDNLLTFIRMDSK
jgi:16S rRNA (guanine966-N2)-methyltransferase